MRILFFGTSSFAARILTKLIEGNQDIVAIVTRPDRFKGRHLRSSFPPVKETALKVCPDVPLFQPEKASVTEFAERLRPFEADLFVVVAYGEIIKKNLLEMPRLGCINIHASLLPKFRGAAPMQRCLMAGETQTGVTIIEMTAQMDAGDVLTMEAVPIPEDMTFGELDAQLCELGAKLLFSTIQDLQQGTATKTPQDHALSTLAPKLTAEEERIDWKKEAKAIHNQIRALSPLPGAWCEVKINGEPKRLKIKRSTVVLGVTADPGTLVTSERGGGWIVACGKDALRLLEVQLEGKKAIAAEECLRGIRAGLLMA